MVRGGDGGSLCSLFRDYVLFGTPQTRAVSLPKLSVPVLAQSMTTSALLFSLPHTTSTRSAYILLAKLIPLLTLHGSFSMCLLPLQCIVLVAAEQTSRLCLLADRARCYEDGLGTRGLHRRSH